MFSLLPPIGMVDITLNSNHDKNLTNDLDNCNGNGDNCVDFIVISQESRPSSETSVYNNKQQRPGTFDEDSTKAKEQFEFEAQHRITRSHSVNTIINFEKQTSQRRSRSEQDDNDGGGEEDRPINEGYATKSPQADCYFEQTADHLEGDYTSSQPQKLSFENELTFIPKLNSLSLRIAQSRSSIARRIKIGYESRVAALEEEMAQNFTFKPSISENSSKIADRLKTDFWTRQRLHTERQRKKLETSPSTWSPKAKAYMSPKQNGIFSDGISQRKALGLSMSDQIAHKNSAHRELLDALEAESPYAKSFDRIVFKQARTRVLREHAPQKLQSLKPRALRRIEQRNNRYERDLGGNAEDFEEKNDAEAADIPLLSKRQKKQQSTTTTTSSSTESTDQHEAKQTEASRTNHRRSKTMPTTATTIANQHSSRPRKSFTVDPDRFMRTKIAAEQAIRNKKVFICMGPYPVLRACLRKRGWIEKYFKADIACSKAAQTRSPDNDKDSDDDVVYDEGEASNEREATNVSELQQGKENEELHEGSKQQQQSTGSGACTLKSRKTAEKTCKVLCGPQPDHDSNELDDGFESDSQYGIMSRIVRNSVPTFIWTCRRTDIEFKFLNKDQIVNHFCHAGLFTTKFGLCVNLRQLPWFDAVDPDSFFPKCHRLCSDSERLDFIDNFRMLCAIGIIERAVANYGKTKLVDEQGPGADESQQSTKSITAKHKEKVISTKALLLAMKAGYGYIKSKEHIDIDFAIQGENQGLQEDGWEELVNLYYKITSTKGVMINAESYFDECKLLLEKLMKTYPQTYINKRNMWIVKPGAKSRGRGITVMDNLAEILKLVSTSVSKKENKWVIQKYIERPLLIYNTKFDIRQWFLVTDWNPLTLWFYKDCYLRFCSQEYTPDKLDPEFHLANNSLQKNYLNGPRSKNLPDENMWTQDQYREYLSNRGQGDIWEEVIYPSMKQAITYVLLSCQDSLEFRKNSFELFGADFMLSDDMRPWLIEINSSPAMSASTSVTERLCSEVIEDTCKVVLDRKENRYCGTGKFELVFKQQFIPNPVYTGSNLTVEGEGYRKPTQYVAQSQQSPIKVNRKQRETRQPLETSISLSYAQNDEEISRTDSWLKLRHHKSCDKSCDFDATIKPIRTSGVLMKELSNMKMSEKKLDSWRGCICGEGKKCQVASAYHVSNPSLELPTTHKGHHTLRHSHRYAKREDDICRKQALKISRMNKRGKNKIAYATLKYKSSSEGPGLSIGPGNGVKQM
eukprot:gene6215-6931_t